jgi:hypothetical protein
MYRLLPVKLGIVPEDAHTERRPPLTAKILLDTLLLLHARIERLKQRRVIPFPRLQLLWKRKLQPAQHMPNRGIRIAQLIPNEVLAMPLLLVPLEHPLEVSQKLWDPVLAKVLCFLQGFFFLVLVVFCDGDGVVGIVGFVVQILSRSMLVCPPAMLMRVGDVAYQRRQCVRENPRLLRLIAPSQIQLIAQI